MSKLLTLFKNAYFAEIFRAIFGVSLALYFILYLLEWWRSGFVSLYFNPDIILATSILSGILFITSFDF